MKWILGISTVVWAAVLVVQVGGWSSVHAVPLQGRDIAVSLPAASEFRAVHVLVDGCACSRTVADYLARRGAQPGWQEQVWILDGPAATIPGFVVTAPNRDLLSSAGLVGGPRLLLFSPAGQLIWSGGYGPAKPRTSERMLDLPAMQSARGGAIPDSVPVFGCPRPSLIRS